MINKQNLIAYLKFLEPKLGKTFSQATLEAWGNIPEGDINTRLQKMYSNLNWEAMACEVAEKDFLASQQAKPVTIHIAPAIRPTVSLTNFNPNTESIEAIPFYDVTSQPNEIEHKQPITISEIAAQHKQPTNTPNHIPPSHTASNIPPAFTTQQTLPHVAPQKPTSTYYPQTAPKNKGILNKIFLGLFILCLLVGGFVGYKYYEFCNLNMAYTLADNLAIHSSDDDVSPVINRMDLFGTSLKATGEIQQTLNGLKVIGNSGGYTKVLLQPNFTDYLLNKTTTIGYINSKYITEDETEFARYKKVFAAFKNDYNEMDKLQFNYRKLIVTAFNQFAELKSSNIAPPSLIETKLSDKAGLSIGQIKEKDALNNIKNIYATFQINNGQYYTVKGNKDGTMVESVWPVVIRTLAVKPKANPYDTINIGPINIDISPVTDFFVDSGKPEAKENLTTKGKFKVTNSNPQELIFTAADNSIIARTKYAPYNTLVRY